LIVISTNALKLIHLQRKSGLSTAILGATR
jgi:hypothetical protein